MSFDVTINYGATETPIVISGTVLPEEATPSAVSIKARLPKEHGINYYSVRTDTTEKVSVQVLGYHLLAVDASPIIEVEALTGDFAHAVEVQAQLADGQIVRGMCPMGCTIVLEPLF